MGRKMTPGGPEVENAPGGGRGRGRGGGREEDDLGRKTASGGPEAENAPGGGRGKGQGAREGRLAAACWAPACRCHA